MAKIRMMNAAYVEIDGPRVSRDGCFVIVKGAKIQSAKNALIHWSYQCLSFSFVRHVLVQDNRPQLPLEGLWQQP